MCGELNFVLSLSHRTITIIEIAVISDYVTLPFIWVMPLVPIEMESYYSVVILDCMINKYGKTMENFYLNQNGNALSISHTHTHTYIYIYIYIKKNKFEKQALIIK